MKKLLWVSLLCQATVMMAQDIPPQVNDISRLEEQIYPIQNDDSDNEERYEAWLQMLAHPSDLNRITEDELRQLMILSEKEIGQVMHYRAQYGPFLSVYELQAVPGLSMATISRLAGFVTVRDAQTRLDASIIERMKKEKNHYLLLRYDRILESQDGYGKDSSGYSGSQDHMTVRYRLSRPHDFSLGFSLEKDAGERLQWSPPTKQYGFDYLSWHIQLTDKGKWKNILIGNFQIQMGQGLIWGGTFGFGKNSETITSVRRGNLGFLPYTSMTENASFNGGAVTYSLSKRWQLHGFLSQVDRDAKVAQQDSQPFVTSLQTSGLHRSLGELSSRKTIREFDGGMAIEYTTGRVDAGMSFHHLSLSMPIRPGITPYGQYAFRADHLSNAGLFFNINTPGVTIFMETAYTLGYGRATTAGAIGNISNMTEVSLLLRVFDRDFTSFCANPFAENSRPQNETGLYTGFRHRFSRRVDLSGYVDLFRFPWLSYRDYSPSEGHEWMARLTWAPKRQTVFYLQIREQAKMRNLSTPSTLYLADTGTKRNLWMRCEINQGPWIFRTAIQLSQYMIGSVASGGLGIAQDLGYRHRKWSFSFRFALFDTDDYDNRLYFYEKDVWLGYSFPAYDGKGIRRYAVLSWKISRRLECWIRWSGTRYFDRTEIGSGAERIPGNMRNDAKFQLRIAL